MSPYLTLSPTVRKRIAYKLCASGYVLPIMWRQPSYWGDDLEHEQCITTSYPKWSCSCSDCYLIRVDRMWTIPMEMSR